MAPDPRGPSRFLRWAVVWAAFGLMWLLFASTLTTSEVVAGLIAAALASVATWLVHRQGLVAFRPRARWMVMAWGLPYRVLADFVIVSAALWRHLLGGRRVRGAFRAVPFPKGGPHAAARRSVAVAVGSLSPNAYVVGFEGDHALVHELVPGDPVRTAGAIRPE